MNRNFDIHSLVRENIRNLKPYRSARDDFKSGVLMDANENALGAPFEDDMELNRYPMPYQEELRGKIAAYRGLQSDQVFVGVGSDEAIDLLFRIFCRPGKDRVIVNTPTYGMYKVSAAINDVVVDEVLLTEDFQLQPEKILAAVQPETKLIFVCSPNNPTGNVVAVDDIISLLDNFNGIVVVDEAYIDFSSTPGFSERLNNYPNLVILQTLSKSFGLAGIRLGIALASAGIIDYMMKVKAPYNINKLTSRIALKAFDNLEVVSTNIDAVIQEREAVRKRLMNYPQVEYIHPSDANFLLFRIKNAKTVYEELAKEGVIIRYRGKEPHCEDCLRLTIGNFEENNLFFTALEKVIKN